MSRITNYQDKWEVINLKVTDLNLDPNNIRLETIHKTERDIIADLFVNEDTLSVLKSIYENGFYPDESPVIIREKDKYVVVEGNRRVASLKSMVRPKLAPPKFADIIEDLMRGRTPIEKIEVRLAPGRDDVIPYLAAKHTKNTRKPWSALRRAYFYYAQIEKGESIQNLIKKFKGVDIPSYIKMYEMHFVAKNLHGIDNETRKKVSTKFFNISTLERIYNDRYVRDKLGIQFNTKTGRVTIPKSPKFDIVFSKIVTSIVNKEITSRERIKDESQRKQYIDELLPQKISAKEGITTDKIDTENQSKSTRVKLVPKDIKSTLKSPGIEKRLQELQSIPYRRFPNATHDMLRSFLESVIKKFLNRIGTPVHAKREGGYVFLDNVLDALIEKLKNDKNHEMRQVTQNIKRDKEFMESINHNPSIFSTHEKVEEQWDQMEDLIRYIFAEFEKIDNEKITRQ